MKTLKHYKREDFAYQAAYCEENIWHLCQQNDFNESFVIFIFSRGDAFPMLNQRASLQSSLPIFWDYHVVLLHLAETTQILDFDTTLAFNTDIKTYFRQSFIDESLLIIEQRPLFRLIPANKFIQYFSSDRRHMKTTTGWLAPPPNWPCIGRSGSNLSGFIQARKSHAGELLTYNAILKRFA